MSDKISSNVLGKQEPVEETPASTRVAYRAGLFVLFLIYAQRWNYPGRVWILAGKFGLMFIIVIG